LQTSGATVSCNLESPPAALNAWHLYSTSSQKLGNPQVSHTMWTHELRFVCSKCCPVLIKGFHSDAHAILRRQVTCTHRPCDTKFTLCVVCCFKFGRVKWMPAWRENHAQYRRQYHPGHAAHKLLFWVRCAANRESGHTWPLQHIYSCINKFWTGR
jgi:hypothetical protein